MVLGLGWGGRVGRTGCRAHLGEDGGTLDTQIRSENPPRSKHAHGLTKTADTDPYCALKRVRTLWTQRRKASKQARQGLSTVGAVDLGEQRGERGNHGA
jgi:hypothetical protein